MTQKEYFEQFETVCREMVDLTHRKNNNYANVENAFANFEQIEQLTAKKISREEGIFVRLSDKMSRIGNLLTGTPDQVGEALEDTVKDLAVYAVILLICLRENNPIYHVEKMGNSVPFMGNSANLPKPSITQGLANFFKSKAA